MPKKTKSTKSVKPKVYKKRTKRAVVNRSLAVVGQGFPKKMLMTHKYFQTFDISNIAGATASYQWVANGMFDPDATGGGAQPLYFDQMANVYSHYTIIGSKITVTVNQALMANTNAIAGLYVNDDGTITPTLTALMEQSTSKYVILPHSSNNTKTLRAKWSAKKNFGGSILANNNLEGTSGANPPEQSIYTLVIYPQNLSSSQTYNCQVMIEYIAVWKELRDIAGS